MLINLLKHMCQTTGLTLDGLLALSNEPVEIKTMGFSMHKGKALKDVPVGWFEWYLKQEATDPDLVASIRKIHPHL